MATTYLRLNHKRKSIRRKRRIVSLPHRRAHNTHLAANDGISTYSISDDRERLKRDNEKACLLMWGSLVETESLILIKTRTGFCIDGRWATMDG